MLLNVNYFHFHLRVYSLREEHEGGICVPDLHLATWNSWTDSCAPFYLSSYNLERNSQTRPLNALIIAVALFMLDPQNFVIPHKSCLSIYLKNNIYFFRSGSGSTILAKLNYDERDP